MDIINTQTLPIYPSAQTLPISTELFISILIGLFISTFVILCWCFWAYVYFRYMPDRIDSKIVNKYSTMIKKIIDKETEYIRSSNIRVSPDKKYVTADMLILKKEDNMIVSNEPIKLIIDPDCSVFSSSCISL